MRSVITAILLSGLFFFQSCADNEEAVVSRIPAKAFHDSLKAKSNIQLIDVRTANEYAQGSIADAKNIDFNAPDFKEEIAGLDKEAPVYLYCLGGGRSNEAVAVFKEAGFKEIVELDGGLMSWQKENLPVAMSKAGAATQGISQEVFDQFVSEHQNVVVDFYADWCGPCKRMAPVLEELEKEHKGKFVVYKVNVDQSRALAMAFKIGPIPHLKIFKDGKFTKDMIGFDPNGVEEFKKEILSHYL